MTEAARNGVLVRSDGFAFPGHDGNGRLEVLSGFDIEFGRGEIVAIMAPSGSGKTTLLNAIAGLLDESHVRVEPADLKCAYCFQADRLLPWKSVVDNVLFPLSQRSSEANSEAEGLLRNLGLGGFIDALPHALSGGMRKRVSIARSVLYRPSLLLMDEPLAGLDVEVAELVARILRKTVADRKVATLFVSHDPMHVALTADRVCLMSGPPLRPIEEFPVELDQVRELSDEQVGIEVSRIYQRLHR